MNPHPKDAEQVVQHSGGQAQHHGLKKSRPLGGYIHRHPPSRRESSPPLPPAVVLIGEGIHTALYLHISSVQRQLFDVQVLAPDHQCPLHCGHDDGVFVKTLHLLHPGDRELLPPFQQNVVGRSRRQAAVVVCHTFPLLCFFPLYGTKGTGMTSPAEVSPAADGTPPPCVFRKKGLCGPIRRAQTGVPYSQVEKYRFNSGRNRRTTPPTPPAHNRRNSHPRSYFSKRPKSGPKTGLLPVR